MIHVRMTIDIEHTNRDLLQAIVCIQALLYPGCRRFKCLEVEQTHAAKLRTKLCQNYGKEFI